MIGENTVMLKDILKRIDKRLEAVGLAESNAAKVAGLSKDAIRNIRRAVDDGNDRKGISTNTLVALAPVLQTTAAWLLDETGPETMPPERLRDVLVRASDAPVAVQERIIHFAEYELGSYKSRDTAA
jgi:transcriptional regulator with XRE-family HTH domain